MIDYMTICSHDLAVAWDAFLERGAQILRPHVILVGEHRDEFAEPYCFRIHEIGARIPGYYAGFFGQASVEAGAQIPVGALLVVDDRGAVRPYRMSDDPQPAVVGVALTSAEAGGTVLVQVYSGAVRGPGVS